MSVVTSLKALPLHRILALAGAALLFVSLSLPWQQVYYSAEFQGTRPPGSTAHTGGLRGIGILAGIIGVAIFFFNALRLAKPATKDRREALFLALTALCSILTLAHYGQTTSRSEEGLLGGTRTSIGAHIALLAAIVLIVAAASCFFMIYKSLWARWLAAGVTQSPGDDPPPGNAPSSPTMNQAVPPPPPTARDYGTNPPTSQSDPGV